MTRTVVVPAALAGERVDRAVALLTGITRSEAALLVDSGGVAVGGRPVAQRSHRLKEGDELALRDEVAEEIRRPAAVEPDPCVKFRVVHEDADVIVVDKPPGLVTHPGAGQRRGTLAAGLLGRYPELAELPLAGLGSPERPGIVHRLDKDTSGLLVVARSPRGYRSLTEQLRDRSMSRVYLALAVGELEAAEGVVDAPIGRSLRDPTRMAVSVSGRSARTRYRLVRRFSEPLVASLLELHLETGRTHQIRVHLAAIGHPVVGDRRYGGARGASGVQRVMLHAWQLSFRHPATDEPVSYRAEPPEDFADALRRFA